MCHVKEASGFDVVVPPMHCIVSYAIGFPWKNNCRQKVACRGLQWGQTGPLHLHTDGVGIEFCWLDAPVAVPEVDKELYACSCSEFDDGVMHCLCVGDGDGCNELVA
jgi:hypothetical protein